MLLAFGLPLPRTLLTHAHWTVNRQKMSKSIGNVADPIEAMKKRGVDVVRWYLARVGGRFRDDVGENNLLQLHVQNTEASLFHQIGRRSNLINIQTK
jgi:methionyl-tRNA synthetase